MNEEDLKELKELSTKPLRISPNERKNYYTGWMKITTEDPVRVPVCATKLTLKWEEDIDGLIEETSHKLKPWATNPTKFDTHWCIDSSGDTPLKTNINNSKITYKGYANYYNDDFGLKDWRTHVNHELKMIPRHKSLAFQELVQMYTEAISEIYRSGIDYIGGHSLGGHLAYAITSELSRKGLSPKGVIILDTVPIHEVAMEKFNIEDDAFKVYVLTALIGELLNIDPESVKGMSLTKEKQYVLTKAQEDEMFREVMNRS
ncbi:thioesterase domain-containing protein [Brevibacillus laterosporus]|uniref:Thioesterase domain-containing protein n=1 Tax=Brevibacillus laterosporus TaxID=1465 RepID=A0AAP3DMD8_BRELA|nr:thioesterase domain-containing protein [Brevibacillus laterosporus]MCR8982879.1 thioesterase domain-containing protein [Brevibacillus laterosporus]MCZ0810035.1 thioesterase domain-containing protein [Brevibacillus laterosporus]MCZ0828653.1 thioesterase domain-containing protein [Brevibacillus laterosporus]MCZ0852696.1 thioesterase domain-containing protein [Brevibacillus laterosporus]